MAPPAKTKPVQAPPMEPPLVLRHDRDIGEADVLGVALRGRKASLDRETAKLLDARRKEIVDVVEAGAQVYGFNRGFGHNVRLAVGREGTAALQRNLILSHACGVGEDAPVAVVRAAMLLRAQSLARGHSGVRAAVVQSLLDCLNAQITPSVPRLGSVSASGDLAPLSHIALTLIGEGHAYSGSKRMPAREALAKAQIKPLALEMKEGLALNNGTQYSNALGLIALAQFDTLLKTACVAAAMSAQVMLGADTPFREDLHALRPHAGGVACARAIRKLMENSPMREAHRNYDLDGEIQDPYNLRCAAQILGAAHALIARARATFLTEANAVTDNPIMLERDGKHVDAVSGGHFHAMPLAVDLYGLIQAGAIVAQLTNTRAMRYVDGERNKGLGADLKWPGTREKQAVSSAMMIPEYVTAGLANWLWGLAMPSHLMSIPTDAGQEDHVSMAANVGLRAIEAAARVADVLAVEFAFIAQAAAIRREQERIPSRLHAEGIPWSEEQRRLSPVCEDILKELWLRFPPLKADRVMADEIAALSQFVTEGGAVRIAGKHGVFEDY